MEGRARKTLDAAIQQRKVELFIEAGETVKQAEEILLTAPKKLPKVFVTHHAHLMFEKDNLPSNVRKGARYMLRSS